MTGGAFTEVMELVTRLFEALGVVILLAGVVLSVFLAIRYRKASRDIRGLYFVVRQSFGGAILLGLEVLVAADLIRTVAISPTLESVGVLGMIVLIRTALSFAIDIEIEGVAPWRRAAQSGARHIAVAATHSGESAS